MNHDHHHHNHVHHDPLASGDGLSRVLHLDAQSGISGDMLVAALLDLGAPIAVLEEGLAALPVEGFRLAHTFVERSGIRARRFGVEVAPNQPERTYAEIAAMLANAILPEGARCIAERTFRRLAEAEARVHGVPVEAVHFHEVGAVDSIVDIVGAALLLDHLSAEVVCSPLPLGRGFVRARHGILPLPAPATIECLRGVPTYDAGIAAELVTPTGAALVASVATRFEHWPSMSPLRSGWGAGSRELEDRPNVLRVVLGESSRAHHASELVLMETNVDDTTPEIVAHALERAREEGALDAWSQGIVMKKGRPGWVLSVLCRGSDAQRVARVLFTETSTLGLRVTEVRRVERPRRIVRVETPFGAIAVKVAEGDALAVNLAPELEDCRAAARAHSRPLKEVYEAAMVAARTLVRAAR